MSGPEATDRPDARPERSVDVDDDAADRDDDDQASRGGGIRLRPRGRKASERVRRPRPVVEPFSLLFERSSSAAEPATRPTTGTTARNGRDSPRSQTTICGTTTGREQGTKRKGSEGRGRATGRVSEPIDPSGSRRPLYRLLALSLTWLAPAWLPYRMGLARLSVPI